LASTFIATVQPTSIALTLHLGWAERQINRCAHTLVEASFTR